MKQRDIIIIALLLAAWYWIRKRKQAAATATTPAVKKPVTPTPKPTTKPAEPVIPLPIKPTQEVIDRLEKIAKDQAESEAAPIVVFKPTPTPVFTTNSANLSTAAAKEVFGSTPTITQKLKEMEEIQAIVIPEPTILEKIIEVITPAPRRIAVKKSISNQIVKGAPALADFSGNAKRWKKR